MAQEIEEKVAGMRTTYFVLPNGMKHGTHTQYHKNGTKYAVGDYQYGKKEGIQTWWYPNGRKWGTETFRDDKFEEMWMRWDPDGKKRSEGTRPEGKKDGTVIE